MSVIWNFFKSAQSYTNDMQNNNVWKGPKPWVNIKFLASFSNWFELDLIIGIFQQSPLLVNLVARICLLGGFLVGLAVLRMWIIGFETPKFTPADNPAAFHANLFIRVNAVCIQFYPLILFIMYIVYSCIFYSDIELSIHLCAKPVVADLSRLVMLWLVDGQYTSHSISWWSKNHCHYGLCDKPDWCVLLRNV